MDEECVLRVPERLDESLQVVLIQVRSVSELG